MNSKRKLFMKIIIITKSKTIIKVLKFILSSKYLFKIYSKYFFLIEFFDTIFLQLRLLVYN